MKATGVVRKIDRLGRLVIPKELRRTMGWDEDTPIEFFVIDDNRIAIGEYRRGCIFCGDDEDVKQFNNKLVCVKCRKLLLSL